MSTARQNRRRGQSIVEFALLLPVFLLILWGTIDLGGLLGTHNQIQIAGRQAARLMGAWGSQTPPGYADGTGPDPYILDSITESLSQAHLPLTNLHYVTLYCSPVTGDTLHGCGSTGASCQYFYDAASDKWSPPPGVECDNDLAYPASYDASQRSQGDDIGVAINYTYGGLTPFFRNGVTFTDKTETQIVPTVGRDVAVPTPLPPAVCGAGSTDSRCAPTPTPTLTPVPTNTPTITPIPTNTPTAGPPTPTRTPRPPTATPTHTSTPGPPTPTHTPRPPTATPTHTPTPTITPTPGPPTHTPTPGPPTPTHTPRPPTATPTHTPTPRPTDTATPPPS